MILELLQVNAKLQQINRYRLNKAAVEVWFSILNCDKDASVLVPARLPDGTKMEPE